MGSDAWIIKHKTDNSFFGGFERGPEFNVIWVSHADALRYSNKTHAKSQAQLLRRFGNSIQLKPLREI